MVYSRWSIQDWFIALVVFAFTLTTPVAHAEPLEVNIGVIPGALKFDVIRFDVHPKQAVSLRFTNNGLMPHNIVIGSKPNTADTIIQQAMALPNGYQQHFLPKTKEVLTGSKLLQVKQAQTIKFTTPDAPGEYPYICTFPGHGVIMRGIMRVRPKDQPLEKPLTIKSSVSTITDNLADSTVTPFPLGSESRPLVMRTFVPNIGFDETVLPNHSRGYPSPRYDPGKGRDVNGTYKTLDGLPATISVNYGQSLSFVWDTVECRLLYAWNSGFFDMTNYWGKGSGGSRKGFGYTPRIKGNLQYVTSGALPIRVGKSPKPQTPQFKAMKLVAGSPQFIYKLNGAMITEHIVPAEGGTIAVHYTVHHAEDGLQFVFDENHRRRVSSDIGTWKNNTLTIPGADHLHFHINYQSNYTPRVSKVVNQGGVLSAATRLGQDAKPSIVKHGLKTGAKIFVDREYTFQDVPVELAGADYLKAYNDDKDGSANYRVELKKPATLLLLVDTRVENKLNWLKGRKDGLNLKPTSHTINTDNNWQYKVYTANAKPGTYTFGTQSDGSMYVIAAKELKSK